MRFTYDPTAHGAGSVGGVWLRVLEQAAARVLNNPTLVTFPNVPIRLLTGADSNWRTGFATEANWQNHLTLTLQAGKVALVSTGGGEADGKKGFYKGIVTIHAYIVVGWNPVTNKYILQNPWGRANAS